MRPSNTPSVNAAIRAHRQVPISFQARGATEAIARWKTTPTYVLGLVVIDTVEAEVARWETALTEDKIAAQRAIAGRGRAAAAAGINPADVRMWAKTKGLDCPAKGRYLPKALIDAYTADHAWLA